MLGQQGNPLQVPRKDAPEWSLPVSPRTRKREVLPEAKQKGLLRPNLRQRVKEPLTGELQAWYRLMTLRWVGHSVPLGGKVRKLLALTSTWTIQNAHAVEEIGMVRLLNR